MKIFFTLVFVLVIFSCNERNNNIKVEHYENGGLKSIGRYKNKIINGQVQWFYPNGNIEQLVNFKNGKENGNSYYFYESGTLKNFRHWKEGKMVGWANDFYNDSVWIIQSVLFFNNHGKLIYKKNYGKNGEIISEEGKMQP